MQHETLSIRDWDALYENNRTRDLKRLEWVPIPNKLDGDGYTELVDHPNGAAHLGAWLTIVQIASKCTPRGVLIRDNRQPHTAESLARITRLPLEVFEEAIPRLISIGWLLAPGRQEGAAIPHLTVLEGKGMEGKGMEQTCASCASPDGNARVGGPSIDQTPFETTDPDALFEVQTGNAKPIRGMTAQQEEWFTEWWDSYWLHKAKQPARRAFQKHVRTAGRFQQVMAATRAQAPEMLAREASKRPHGATWLNAERWEDEVLAPAAVQPPAQRRRSLDEIAEMAFGPEGAEARRAS